MNLAEQRDHVRYGTRTMLVLIALAAFACAAAFSTPPGFGSVVLLGFTLLAPGVLITMAMNGGPLWRAFVIGALPPLAFVLYGIGWGFGWGLYGSYATEGPLQYFEMRHGALRISILASWALSLGCGLICVLVGWQLKK